MNITEILLQWYNDNKRDLPWRHTKDPYRIWLSEIILQQTRVDQGMDYYIRFLDNYPNIRVLSEASEQEVLKMWQGLGYYSRARNMLATAKKIQGEHNGVFPADYDKIIKYKGIGQYTASAIASIAFDQPFPVIDGNVKRVISRIYGITAPVNTNKGVEKIAAVLDGLIDRKNPGDFNQAMMEFGALHCRPQNPLCNTCPLTSSCRAYQDGMVEKLPLLKRNSKLKKRTFNYLVALFEQDEKIAFWVRKRTENYIWKNMYDFPEQQDLKIDMDKAKLLKTTSIYKHQLSHQAITARFHLYIITSRFTLHASRDIFPITLNDLHQYPVPRLIDKFIQDELMEEIKILET